MLHGSLLTVQILLDTSFVLTTLYMMGFASAFGILASHRTTKCTDGMQYYEILSSYVAYLANRSYLKVQTPRFADPDTTERSVGSHGFWIYCCSKSNLLGRVLVDISHICTKTEEGVAWSELGCCQS